MLNIKSSAWRDVNKMKKLFIVLVMLFAYLGNVNAQDYAYVDNTFAKKTNKNRTDKKVIEFNNKQEAKAEEISNKILLKKIDEPVTSFGLGIVYNNKLYWYVMAYNGESYFFRSNKDFSKIKYIENPWISLVEVAKKSPSLFK